MSKLFRENDSVVFTHNDIVVKKWDNFLFLQVANHVIGQFHEDKDLQPLSFNDFKKQNNIYSFLNENELIKEYKIYFKKSKHVLFYQKYKITTKNFKRIFNSIMREIWATEPYYSKFCFTCKKPKELLVKKLKKNLHLLQKTKNKNILPIVFWSGLSEETIENIFGENLWKEILKNSEYKNALLSRRIFKKFIEHEVDVDLFARVIPSQYKLWTQIKSTVLKKLWIIEDFNLVFILGNLFKAKDLGRKDLKRYTYTPTEEEPQYKIERTYKTAVRNKEDYSIHWNMDQWMNLYEKLKSKNLI